MNPNLPVVHYQLGFIAFKRAEYSRAIAELRKEIAMDPGFGDAYLYLGLSLRRLNSNIEALPVLKKAVALDPNSPLTYRALAAVQSSTNQTAAALETLQTAQKRFPREAAFPAQMAALLKQMGRAQQAERETVLAESLSREGNPIHALPGEASASSHQSNLAGGSSVAGAADNRGDDTDKAPQPATPAEQQPAAIGTPAGPPSATVGSPMVELRRCVKQRNADCANTALAAISDPAVLRSAEYLTLKADALALNRQKTEALAAINRAIEQNPTDPQYLIALGRTYDKFGDQFSAIESYLKAAKLEPRSAEPFYWLGTSFFLLGERFKSADYYNRAERHFQSVLELAPNNDQAEFMLAVVEVMKSNLDEAQGYLRKAIQMSPSNSYYHLHEGILLRRLGDNQGALGEMRLAEKLNPSNALTHFELGSLLEKMQQYREAKAQLETAVRLNPHLSNAYYHLRGIDAHLGLTDESKKADEQFKLTKAYEEGETSDLFTTVMSSAEINVPTPKF
jgi:tetratricopeptide (TPR) repeat protein